MNNLTDEQIKSFMSLTQFDHIDENGEVEKNVSMTVEEFRMLFENN